MPKVKKTLGSMALEGIVVGLAVLFFLELYIPTEPFYGKGYTTSLQTQKLHTHIASAPQPKVLLLNMVLSRPLFDPTRRPPVVLNENLTAPAEIPRLSGIMVTPTEKIAIFSPAMGASIIVSQNSRFGPFTVLAISSDAVTIKGPSGITVLRSDLIFHQEPGMTTAKTTVLVDGIYLSLIKIALPSKLNW